MLEDLIPELFDEILGLLELRDLYPLRLASPRLEQRTREAFGAAAFSDLTTDFSRASLGRLGSIAATNLRSSVRSLRVGFVARHDARWNRLRYEDPYRDDGHWPRLESGTVDPGSELAGAFVAAVLSFPNCAGVTVTDNHAIMDYHLRKKGLEGRLSPVDALGLVLRAYSSSSSPPLRRLHVRMPIDPDSSTPGAITGATVVSAPRTLAAHLQDLVLQFNTKADEHLTHVLELLIASPRLRTLRVLCRGSRSRENGCRLGQRLEGLLTVAPPLEHLTLGEIMLREADLLRLLSRCRETLETLAFYLTWLEPGSWLGVLQHLHNEPFTRLRRISMQACRDGDRAALAFCPLWKAQRELPDSCSGAFKFRHSMTAGLPRELHIVGVLFESEGRGPDIKPGLRALIEYSHRAGRRKGETPMCDHVREIMEVPRMYSRSVRDDVRDDPHGKWTGLSPDYQYAWLNM